jgi:malate dehydrogenase (oxaloacetate-decarboxylating)(NADP+)
VFVAARSAPNRIVYAEGEDERTLRAVQIALEEGLVKPILIGRPAVIAQRIQRAGLRLKPGSDFELINPEDDPRFRQYWETYHRLKGRDGISPEMAKSAVRRSNTLIAALGVYLGHADGLLCGIVGRYEHHLEHLRDVIGQRRDTHHYAALNALVLDKYTLFIADTFVNDDPDADTLAEIAALAAEAVTQFGLVPKVAFLSHSMFGSSTRASARKMRVARDLFGQRMPGIEADGEMQGDAALSESVRATFLAESTLSGSANVLILPNLDAANILFNVLKMTGGGGVTVGPILLGTAAPAHILTPSATVRRILNMTAVTVMSAASNVGVLSER